jgi:magnesium-transporting ATPase (P-type)
MYIAIKTVIGWLIVTTVLAIMIFVLYTVILATASAIVFENLFTLKILKTMVFMSLTLGAVLSAIMIAYDFHGFIDTLEGKNRYE